MVPIGEDEAEALKVVGLPGVPAVKLKAAVGAWSGVMAMPSGPFSPPPVIGAFTVLVARSIGVTEVAPGVAT